jgi:DNA-binding transcriptional regulator GbsR (MarR family)
MAIFQKLSGGPIAVNELARLLPVSRPAVSQHLRVLKDAGLVTDSKDGTRRIYQLNPEGIARLRAHFDQVWDTAMSSFQNAVEQTPKTAVEQNPSEKIPNGESHDNNRRRSRRP